ncbi:MAG: serine/threonine protein kinase [Myxococcales bacterium]|nr:serine/threonine protein kinase [Myxococcales bacterium]
MKDPGLYVQSLIDLPKRQPDERRVLFRQAVAALSRASIEEGPGPLEGLNPDAVAAAVKVALAGGLFEDLDWLAPPAAGRALYLLAAALPAGAEQRDLGRRVLSRLFSGSAETFVGMATAMALSGGKGLSSAGAAARVALVSELPLMQGVADGPLALALVSRRELAREWIVAASTTSLPARRLAARLLERAAREAAKRASQGDAHALRVFRGDAIQAAFSRLLADRESLVWRHVAIARGLVAPWLPEPRRELEGSLSPDLSPTEWRRGATSIAAYGAVRPEDAERLAVRVFKGELVSKDPGVAGAFVWGLPRVAEAEPDAASLLLGLVLRSAPEEVADAVLYLRDELGPSHFYDGAAKRVLAALPKEPADDDGLRDELRRDLEGLPREREPLRREIERALSVYAQDSAQAAYQRAVAMLESTKVAFATLDAAPVSQSDPTRRAAERRASLAVLRDLDTSLLERNVVGALLRLDTSQEKAAAGEAALESLRDHLATWMLARQFPEPVPGKAREVEAAGGLGLLRVRSLLHLVDGDTSSAEDPAQAARQRHRWQTTATSVLATLDGDEPVGLRRALLATLARALDALIRTEQLEVADAFLCVAERLHLEDDFRTLSEAAMNPDHRHTLAEYASFVGKSEAPKRAAPKLNVGPYDSLFPPADDTGLHLVGFGAPIVRDAEDTRVAKLARFADELFSEGSGKAEALRAVLVRLQGVLGTIARARSLRGLGAGTQADAEVVQSLESAVVALANMMKGARSRLYTPGAPVRKESRFVSGAVRLLSVVVGRVLSGAEARIAPDALAASLEELTRGLPRAISDLVTSTTMRLAEIPVDPIREEDSPASLAHPEQLPPWLPARRVLGAFYVLRQLGVGGAGSVFVVHRVEDRNDPTAEKFALKVPDYDASAARSLSEAEFLDMFRSEASALVGLPPHPNLARFVTFDLAARPKPILVMELVEGLTLELAVQSLALDMPRVLRALRDLLAGLSVMHEAGLGHLDVKPSNVVLRGGEVAVLVDFGLAGRKLRPGCASGPYGAPEIWVPRDPLASPLPADVYAFGCLVFEALTGEVLFDAEEEVALVSSHLVHDGGPQKLTRLAKAPGMLGFAGLVLSCLRRDPAKRPTIGEIVKEIETLSADAAGHSWPVELPPP